VSGGGQIGRVLYFSCICRKRELDGQRLFTRRYQLGASVSIAVFALLAIYLIILTAG
jgi:hypothetical protein